METSKLLTDLREEDQPAVRLEQLGWLAGAATGAALAVIIFATGFPFHFSVQLTATKRAGFFLLWLTPVAKSWIGWGLNVLLFIPFGCGLAWWGWTRAWSTPRRGMVAGCSAFFLSCGVEYMQLFLPLRSSSWDDVAMNTLGGLVGWFLFEWAGVWALRLVGDVIGELTSMFES